jgi:hypothetical protein
MHKHLLILFWTPVTFTSFFSCNSQNNQSNIEGFQVFYSMEVPNEDGTIATLTNSYCVFYYDTVDFVSYHYDRDISTEKVYNVTEKEAYLFYKDTQTFCQLDTIGGGFTVRLMPIPVQAVKAKLEPAKYINPEPDSTVYDRSTGDTVEYYYMHSKTPEYGGRMVKLYYSEKYRKYKESFDSSFDKLKGKKLYKYEQINDAYYSKEYKMYTPRLKTIYEMRDLSPDDIKKAKRAVDYYLKMPK